MTRCPPRTVWTCALLVAAINLFAPAANIPQSPSQPASRQTAAIRGTVFSTLDNKPISGALVSVFGTDRSVLTDDKGQFAFTGVPLGSIVINSKKPGFLCSWTDPQPRPKCSQSFDLWSGDMNVTLSMRPQAVITGRILDHTGEPIENLYLCLMKRELDDGVYAWHVVGQSSRHTNAEGSFRMAELEPGTYILRTSAMPDPQRGPEHLGRGYAPTYYPGTTSQSDAKTIAIHAGDEINLNLTVTNQKFEQVTLSFAWARDWKTGSVGFGVTNTLHEDQFQSDYDGDHHLFHIFVPAGDYSFGFTIYPPNAPNTGDPTPWPDGSKLSYLGTVKFTVKDQSVVLTEIPSAQAIDLPLHVRSEFTQQEKRKAAARPQDGYPPPGAGFRLSGGDLRFNNEMTWESNRGPSDFEFKDIPPGRYVLEAWAFQNSYIASLTCGTINLLREPLVVGPGIKPCSIDALVRDDIPSLSVELTPDARARMTAANVTVTDLALIPLEGSLDSPYSSFVWLGSEPRKYAIPPGTYLAILFDGRGIAWRDPDELKRLMALGKIVTLAPGDNKSVVLDWHKELNSGQPIGVALGHVLP